ncbi:hypothetical protein J2S20_000450 [Moryella indoligenes]|uniref:ERF superfamily protein n=1 Tax=Moryella indoligenes TaxID=371674 RepID=A0AAE3V8W8_9FIRM|nr:ERF family protein [Moryella indoligenes]MDQ0151770.1 hypothetical protein [Moryella indoligenes]
MANIYEAMNVRQKLAKARLYFLNQKVQKSGKNMHLEFKYFELEDIVPPAIRIFARVGLTTNIEFTDDKAVMSVFNADNIEEAPMTFTVPYREVKPIISNQGKEVTNPMQALGSSITYLRRYLWMAVLDITEPDDIDANLGSDDQVEEEEIPAPNPETAKKEKKKKSAAPATPKEREEAKKEMTGTDGQADELQIKALKEACKTLMDKDSDQEEFVQQIAMKTNGFTHVTRAACEQLIQNLGEMIAAYGE